ncbi:MAG: GNAT family N-acetyltransferase [Micrococcales bacterium]|nr:GNAT family N-acetyltransferase [Micrococcales bacterium]
MPYAAHARLNEHGQPVGADVEGWTPRPLPDPDVLHGTTVRLERLGPQHVADLFAATCGPGSDADWTYMPAGPFGSEGELAAYLEVLAQDPDVVPLAIVEQSSGAAVGMAEYLRIVPGIGAIEVGHIVFGPRLARTTGATEAMYLMARHAIDELGYRRYEWKCDDLNAPSRAAAVRLGFTYEGTWRQATLYKGRNRDTAWYAMTDGDWQALRPAYERWLAGAEGAAQSERLSELTAAALLTREGEASS